MIKQFSHEKVGCSIFFETFEIYTLTELSPAWSWIQIPVYGIVCKWSVSSRELQTLGNQ